MLRRSIAGEMRIPTLVLRDMEDRIIPKLRSCTNIEQLKRIHAHIITSSLSQSCYLATQIINVCNSIGRVDYAALVFNQVLEPNVYLYNAMIRDYAQNQHYMQGINLYKQLLTCPQAQVSIFVDEYTYPFVLKACGGLPVLNLGKQVHTHVFKSGLISITIIQNSLIEMYTKCGVLVEARKVFDEMDDRDVVSWNTLISAHARVGEMRKARALFDSMPNRTIVSWTALISGYNSAGRCSDAIAAFHQMQLAGFEPDGISIASVLPACAKLGALELGKWIHAYSDKHRFSQRPFVRNALIEMYAKCGSIDQALQLFNGMIERDVISWSTMIAGLATHGRAREAVELFVEMEKDGRVRPNSITFLGVLSACAHAGMLDEGLKYFDSMAIDYGIPPEIEHYGCIIDLLGRSGCIGCAMDVMNSMQIAPDAAIWGSLLSACRTHGNIETAIIVAERLLDLEPEDTGNYVLLSNIYAAAERWEGVAKMRKMIRNRSTKKTPGSSSIEVNNDVREFVAGKDSVPEFGEIVHMLKIIGTHSTMEVEEKINSLDSCDELYADTCFFE